MSANLYRVILPVTDIDLAAKFYGTILDEPGKRVSNGRHYFGGDSDGAILACYDPKADGDDFGEDWHHHPLQYIYFSVLELETAHKLCESAGAKEITSIKSEPWGETMFFARDPFNNPISFVQGGTEFTG